ncbi:unnamed protein product [Peniophora sp. CBMAI 1063]|nr:unnamed protein product [Peniophora sp. CBMAI 1063]
MPSWFMFNIDDREKAHGVQWKLPEFIFSGHEWIVKLLARVALPSADSPEDIPSYYSTVSKDKWHELGALSVLPPEIIAIIFLHIDFTDDAVCFAVAHRLLGYEGYRAVVELRQWEWDHLGSWRGARIITVSSEIVNLPKGMLNDAEKDEFEKLKSEHGLFWGMDKRSKWAAPDDMAEFYEFWGLKPAQDRVSQHRGDELRVRLLFKDTDPYYAPQETWALCNLDTMEYICAKAIADIRGKIWGKHRGPWNGCHHLDVSALLARGWSMGRPSSRDLSRSDARRGGMGRCFRSFVSRM